MRWQVCFQKLNSSVSGSNWHFVISEIPAQPGMHETRKDGTVYKLTPMYVFVITWPRVPYAIYWHSSDVMPEGRRPNGITSLLCQYLAYAHEGPCNN